MSVTDEIKARLDIVTYIQQFATLKKSGRTYKACCPFHPEKTPSFVVNPDTQTWRCFGACAEGGDIFKFAMKQHGWSFPEALQELGRLAGVETRKQSLEQQAQGQRADHLRAALSEAAERYHHWLTETPAGADALRYAREKRGFTDETIRRFRVGFAPPGWQTLTEELKPLGFDEATLIEAGLLVKNEAGRVYDRFRNRLVIPIRDERGRVIGFGARALNPDDNPKYLNSPQTPVFDKSRTLFGLDTAKQAIRDTGVAVIVEGYMDAVQAQQAGFHNVVAQMGTAMTEAQLRLLAPRWAKKIILALDSDAAGQNATLRSLEVARQTLQADYTGKLSVDIRILQIPGAKDPDDLIRETPDQWARLVETATPVADYVIEVETAALPQNATIHEREEVARRVLPILLASENDLYSKDNLQKLALRLRIAERDLLAWAQEQTRIQQARAQREAQPRRPAPPTTQAAEQSADEPYFPPADDSALEIPPDDGDDLAFLEGDLELLVQPAAPLRPLARPASALETACLRLLLRNPDLLPQLNRRFRELADEKADLLNGPLADLGVDDFEHSDHRLLMQHLLTATRQDALDVLVYLREHLDSSGAQALDHLLTEEGDIIRERIRARFDGDAAHVWKDYERRVIAYIDPLHALLDKALRLRSQRLERERRELESLQREAQAEGDEAGQMNYTRYMITAMQAKRLIDAALKQQSAHFV